MRLESITQDVRDAFRLLRRATRFSAAAVLILALAIAGTTVMFTLIDGVLLRPLPVRDERRVIVAWKEARTAGSARYPFGNTEIEAVAEASQLLEAAAGVTRNGVARSVIGEGDTSSYVNVALVTGGFFDVLGVQPVLGRTLALGDDKAGAEHAIVISHGLWQRRYGGAADVIGRHVSLGDQPFAIVGVMPPDLDFPTDVEIWRPTSTVPADGPFGDAARREVNLIGRTRPGVSLEQATSEITALSERLDREAPPTSTRGLAPVVRSFSDVMVGDVSFTMLALFGAVALVLVIASANVANLLLMRGEARRTELAMRAALGASRARIVRQILAESLVLSIPAGLAGLAIAWVGLPALVAAVPDGLPRLESIRIDARVVLFSSLLMFVTALMAGLIPAVLCARADLNRTLRAGGAGPGLRTRGRRALVVAQVALAVTVVAGAGVLVRSVLKLHAIDLGVPAERLVLLDLHVPPAKYGDRQRHERLLNEVIAQLESVPAIGGVTAVNVAPFENRGWDVPRVTVEGQGVDQAAGNPTLNLESILPNYFAALEVPIVQGRAFTPADRQDTVSVAIVSDDAASRLWPGQDPIGKRLKMGPATSRAGWLEVVGVAAQTRYRTVTTPRPTLYLPAAQFQMTARLLIVRTAASLDLLSSVATDRIRTVDRDLQVMRVAAFGDLLDRPLARARFSALLLGGFAAAALLLAAIGLYAVMSTYVKQRNREIALRLALGADVRSVRQLFLSEAARLVGTGAFIGAAGAVASTRFLQGMLYEVDALDPPSIAMAAALLVLAAAVASYGPVRRAAHADLTLTLRSD
jgi:predicted permease